MALDDDALLEQCDVHVYRSSGPGGQHRNKASSAVRLRHRPTGVSAHGDDSRSQHQNKRMALRRLRMNIACQVRRPLDAWGDCIPAAVASCVFRPRGRGDEARPKLAVGARDQRFWQVAAFILDLLEARRARLSDAAAHLGVSTGNLASFLQSDRHLLTAAQAIRKAHGQKPLA
jgi:hypothetical protein